MNVPTRPAEEQVQTITLALHARFKGVDPCAIATEVAAEFEAFEDVRINDYVSLLVERRVRMRLEERRDRADEAAAP
jgi:hypothetical protein